jgi:hypothetical protein
MFDLTYNYLGTCEKWRVSSLNAPAKVRDVLGSIGTRYGFWERKLPLKKINEDHFLARGHRSLSRETRNAPRFRPDYVAKKMGFKYSIEIFQRAQIVREYRGKRIMEYVCFE